MGSLHSPIKKVSPVPRPLREILRPQKYLKRASIDIDKPTPQVERAEIKLPAIHVSNGGSLHKVRITSLYNIGHQVVNHNYHFHHPVDGNVNLKTFELHNRRLKR